jgi:tRNA pseudouridine38-40 synthase
MRYKLNISYDGIRYHGWQRQREVTETVAGVLEEAFCDTFRVPLSLVAASRTDAGVHAYNQVARCTTELDLEPTRLQEIWNRALPSDIVIRGLSKADPGFHPQRNVLYKVYWYHLFAGRPLPFIARYGWYVGRPLDYELLQACLDQIIGTHDFRSFCTGDDIVDTVRTIQSATITPLKKYSAHRIALQGPSFLYKMIRRIVGAAVYTAGHSHLSLCHFTNVFSTCNPLHTLPTAPAHGLLLRKIVYDRT